MNWLQLRELEVSPEELLNILQIEQIPVDVFEIARRIGCKLYRFKEPPKDHSGFIDSRGHIPKIVINRDVPLTVQRFTVAHEIGHLLMHSLGVYDHHTPSKSNCLYLLQEKQANRFAARLLIPRHAVRELLIGGATVEQMASIFLVSRNVMDERVECVSRGGC